MKTLILYEQHGLLRDGLAKLFGQSMRFELIRRSSNLRELEMDLSPVPPHYVIIGSSLLTDTGVSRDVLELIHDASRRSAHGCIHTVVLIGRNDYALAEHFLSLGFSGLVCEHAPFFEFEHTLDALACGGAYLPSILAERVPDAVTKPGSLKRLTSREIQVLQRVSMGCSSKEMASQLGISVSTIDVYRKRILSKLGVHSVAELTKCALKMGLTTL
jgi:DNA-binding NarL/FixJ family response regulator